MDKFRYSNILNTEYILSTTSASLNVFMVLCYKAYNNGNELITLDFDYLKQLLNVSRQSEDKLIQVIERLKKDLMKCVIKINPVAIKALKDGKVGDTKKPYFVNVVLFPIIITDAENRVLRTKVCSLPDELFNGHPEYKEICEEYILSFFNELKEYTLIDLQEYIGLKSKYSKNLYRILKQFNSTGWREISLEDLRACLDCGNGYTNKEFMRTCLYPAVKELEETMCFKDLKVELKKDEHKRGKPIKGFRFTFAPEKPEKKTPAAAPTVAPVEEKKPRKSSPKKNAFNNFQQREYDFEDLERRILLGNEDASPD